MPLVAMLLGEVYNYGPIGHVIRSGINFLIYSPSY